MYITPCVGICVLENDICKGCNRTKEEITNWTKYSDEQRMTVMKRLGYGKRNARDRRRRLSRNN